MPNQGEQDLLNLVSHELRSPLAPMRMWLQTLRAAGANEELRRRATDAIDKCISIQVAMIDDLIDVARGQQGALRIERRPLDLQVVVSGAVETFAPVAAAKQISLGLEVDAGPLLVAGDETRLQQIVINLLSNAVASASETKRVIVTLARRDGRAQLCVSDDGRGLDERQLARIFEPFRAGDGRTAFAHGGLGLGLAIVRHLVERHDGTIVAESLGAGRGSRFVVSLPLLP